MTCRFLVTCITSCLIISSAAEAKPQTPSLIFGPEASGQEVSLRRGQKLTIKLPGNPTTGYQWSVSKIAGTAVRRLGEIQYRPSAGAGKLVGAGGEYSLSLRAVSAGTTEIQLDYARPWESKPERTFTFRAVCPVDPDVIETAFLCPDGSRIAARFLVKKDALQLSWPGRKVTLRRAVSASGARYVGGGVEFWNKGDDARVTEGGREYTCRARK